MKTIKNIILLNVITVLFACQNNGHEEIDIYGKWWSYDISQAEYCEYNIDKDSIRNFSHSMGNSRPMEYKIDRDTLYYLNGKFIINMISKNQFALTIGDITDTLARLSDSIITFHTIDYKNDSIFNSFYTQFTERAHTNWIKYGYVTKKQLKESFMKENDIEEEIILINKK